MSTSISALAGSASPPSANSGAGATTTPPPPSEEMFLTLLVSQLKNQDPLNPADSTQFVSQLAQFSELEQVIGIRNDIETAQAAAASGTQTAPNSANTSAGSAQQSSSGANSANGNTPKVQ